MSGDGSAPTPLSPSQHSVTREFRVLGREDAIPYDLLLLADETRESIDRYALGGTLFVMLEEGKPIAVCAVVKQDDKTVELKNVAVAEERQGRGIGSDLIQRVCAVSAQNGYETALIGTGDIAVRQIALYERLGFAQCGVRKNFFVDLFPEPIFENGIQLCDMVVLKKDLLGLG